MASSKTVLEISIFIILMVLVTRQKTDATKRDTSDLLSLLTNKLQHQQPLIIVLDKDVGVKQDRVGLDKDLSSETSGEAAHLVHHVLGHDQLKKKGVLPKRNIMKPYYQTDEKKRQQFRSQRLKEEQSVLQKEDKTVLRSPIVKKLLRISNSLRCEAKDECQDKCNNKYYGVNGKKCHIQCEIKYVCEEEEQKDDCGYDNDCKVSEEEFGSTKGEKMFDGFTENPMCKRC